MRWTLPFAAAAFGLVTAPAIAGSPMFDQDFGTDVHPALAGHVELGVGPESFSETFGSVSESSSHALFEAAGRGNVPLGGMWNLEAELAARSSWESGASSSSFGAYGHLWRMFPTSAFGVFAGISSGDLAYPLPFTVDFPGDTYTAGVEGEAYFNRLTLGGQASFNTTDFGPSLPFQDYHGWQVRGYAAYYFDPDTKIVGDVRYTDFSAIQFPPQQDRWDFIGSAEHRFAGTPWSIWASGSYSTFSSDFFSGDQWSALVGFRLFLDDPGSTLYKHDREVPFKYDNQLRLMGAREA